MQLVMANVYCNRAGMNRRQTICGKSVVVLAIQLALDGFGSTRRGSSIILTLPGPSGAWCRIFVLPQICGGVLLTSNRLQSVPKGLVAFVRVPELNNLRCSFSAFLEGDSVSRYWESKRQGPC
jgi:hypothetical protein